MQNFVLKLLQVSFPSSFLEKQQSKHLLCCQHVHTAAGDPAIPLAVGAQQFFKWQS